MSSTNTLNRTLNYASVHVGNKPLIGIGGFATEPGFTIGDWVRNFILSPPFAWRWNRAITSFTTTAGVQDYSKSLPTFGWMEQAALTDGSGNISQLLIMLNLADDNTQNLPVRIAARLDDDAGNITFRLLPAPNTTYTVTISYQMAASTFAQINDTWAPIPDYLSYLYTTGFLAKTYEFTNDERFPFSMQLFLRQLVSANGGLDDSQINIFLGDIVNTQRTLQSGVGNPASGQRGRSGY